MTDPSSIPLILLCGANLLLSAALFIAARR